MTKYSEQDLKYAAEFREEIHEEALARVKAVFPDADHVVDEYPADAYFQEVWDYPGQWYTVVGTPPGTGGKKDLTETVVRQTLEYYRNKGTARSDEFFSDLSRSTRISSAITALSIPMIRKRTQKAFFLIAGSIRTVLLWNAPSVSSPATVKSGLTIRKTPSAENSKA